MRIVKEIFCSLCVMYLPAVLILSLPLDVPGEEPFPFGVMFGTVLFLTFPSVFALFRLGASAFSFSEGRICSRAALVRTILQLCAIVAVFVTAANVAWSYVAYGVTGALVGLWIWEAISERGQGRMRIFFSSRSLYIVFIVVAVVTVGVAFLCRALMFPDARPD